MRIKLDENLPRRLKGTLASLQHDVVRVEDEHLLAQPDTVVAAAARKENRVLFSHRIPRAGPRAGLDVRNMGR